jgi:hypothetical protein
MNDRDRRRDDDPHRTAAERLHDWLHRTLPILEMGSALRQLRDRVEDVLPALLDHLARVAARGADEATVDFWRKEARGHLLTLARACDRARRTGHAFTAAALHDYVHAAQPIAVAAHVAMFRRPPSGAAMSASISVVTHAVDEVLSQPDAVGRLAAWYEPLGYIAEPAGSRAAARSYYQDLGAPVLLHLMLITFADNLMPLDVHRATCRSRHWHVELDTWATALRRRNRHIAKPFTAAQATIFLHGGPGETFDAATDAARRGVIRRYPQLANTFMLHAGDRARLHAALVAFAQEATRR